MTEIVTEYHPQRGWIWRRYRRIYGRLTLVESGGGT